MTFTAPAQPTGARAEVVLLFSLTYDCKSLHATALVPAQGPRDAAPCPANALFHQPDWNVEYCKLIAQLSDLQCRLALGHTLPLSSSADTAGDTEVFKPAHGFGIARHFADCGGLEGVVEGKGRVDVLLVTPHLLTGCWLVCVFFSTLVISVLQSQWISVHSS